MSSDGKYRRKLKSYSWALKAFVSLAIMGGLFHLLHWPYVNYIGLVASIILLVFYPLRYMAKKNKEILDHIKVLIAVAISANIIFHLQHLMYLQLSILALFAYWFFHEGFFYLPIRLDFWNKKENDADLLDDFNKQSKEPPYNYTVDLIYAGGVLLIMGGALFKLMHWPGASMLLIAGCCIMSVIIWFKEI